MSLMSPYREWKAASRFKALPGKQREIVFYAEDGGSYTHYEAILRELTEVRGRDVAYLTSAPDDPILRTDNPRIRPFQIGEGSVRTMLFVDLEVPVLVMTLPDLGTLQLKRSKAYPVHYVYVFHSIVSTHMVYRKGAFDQFDTIFCVGPHHVEEIRRTEKRYGLKEKELVEHGYARLEKILEQQARTNGGPARGDGPIRVLVAPSWSPDGVLETMGVPVTGKLLEAGYQVTIRPHPMTTKQMPKLLDELRAAFPGNERLELDVDMGSSASLHASDVMISDWSGAPFEYAFGLSRPVLFLDVPRKTNNPEYEEIEVEPLEVFIREEIGEVVAPDRLDEMAPAIERLCANPEAFGERIARALEAHVFNVGRSGVVGADHIERIATKTGGAGPTTG
jgi:hypothetical protein